MIKIEKCSFWIQREFHEFGSKSQGGCENVRELNFQNIKVDSLLSSTDIIPSYCCVITSHLMQSDYILYCCVSMSLI
jgi:hypothetical protein